MILIEDVLVSRQVFLRKFVCNLSACKGACCWEGDWGAPLDDTELETLTAIREKLRPHLCEEGNEVIDENGPYTFYTEPGKYGTPLLANGACAYLTIDENGVAQCGIEKAWDLEDISFRKPVSCHLYPLRYETEENRSFQALNYDEWEICDPACKMGESLQVPVYRFVREGIIRQFGSSFYQTLEEIAADFK